MKHGQNMDKTWTKCPQIINVVFASVPVALCCDRGIIKVSKARREPPMTGSDKQIAWAKQIINDALGTINRNISRVTEHIEKYDMQDEQIYLDTWLAAKNQYENVILKTPEAQDASWIIDNRKRMDPIAIIHQVDMIVAANRRK
jgi:hypothetical protein